MLAQCYALQHQPQTTCFSVPAKALFIPVNIKKQNNELIIFISNIHKKFA
jgi:hypothetical protein